MGFPALAGGALALALPKQLLAAQETLGCGFGSGKNPYGNGGTHSLDFPHKIGVFFFTVEPGECSFGGIRNPCRNGRMHSLGFPHIICVFNYGKTQGRVLGPKKTLREARGLTPWFWGRPGLEPGASRMRRPCANPLGNLCTIPMEGP